MSENIDFTIVSLTDTIYVVLIPVGYRVYTLCLYMCPDEEKGCSARDLLMIESCRAENLLSNDIKCVMIG